MRTTRNTSKRRAKHIPHRGFCSDECAKLYDPTTKPRRILVRTKSVMFPKPHTVATRELVSDVDYHLAKKRCAQCGKLLIKNLVMLRGGQQDDTKEDPDPEPLDPDNLPSNVRLFPKGE